MSDDRTMPWARLLFAGFFLLLAGADATRARARDMAGQYQGVAMEIAAALDLREDGRFDYGLSYGALDETASGRWRQEGERIVLDSDPFVPPSLLLASIEPRTGGLEILLDLPDGLSRQYFSAEIAFRNGEAQEFQLGDDGLTLDPNPANPPAALRLLLPLFELASDTVRLEDGEGWLVRMTFEPNDLGKADFADTSLDIEGETLLLERHGRRIRFERVK